MKTIQLVLGLICALSGSALADETKSEKPAAAMPMGPPAEMEQLKFFGGTWSCEGKVHATPLGSVERNVKATQTNTLSLDGRWYLTSSREEKPKGSTRSLESRGMFGWDVATKKLISMGVTNSGSSSRSTATGWEGDKLVWTSEGSSFNATTYKGRTTFTKKGDGEMEVNAEVAGPDGKWIPVRESRCKRG